MLPRRKIYALFSIKVPNAFFKILNSSNVTS